MYYPFYKVLQNVLQSATVPCMQVIAMHYKYSFLLYKAK